MRVEKQRFEDANFCGREITLIGQFFAVGSPGRAENENSSEQEKIFSCSDINFRMAPNQFKFSTPQMHFYPKFLLFFLLEQLRQNMAFNLRSKQPRVAIAQPRAISSLEIRHLILVAPVLKRKNEDFVASL